MFLVEAIKPVPVQLGQSFRHEENLSLIRGKLLFREQIQRNIGYPTRAYCRFFENTVDIPDNQIIRRYTQATPVKRGLDEVHGTRIDSRRPSV